jgi:endo-1,4-beta-xylanase
LGEDPDALLAKFHPVSVEGRAAFSTVNVEGMPFKKALRIDTDKKPQEWMTHLQLFTREKIRAGDLLYVTAWARVVRRTDGKAHGDGRLYASEERGGNQKNSSALYAGDFGIPQKWTRIHFGLRAARDHDADDELKLMFTFGHTSQIVEFGGVAGLNFGPQITKEELPHAELNLNYAGREPNAPWRKAALARIEKHRKNNLRVIVKDASGKPVPNAQIKANMTRHAYWFGSSFPIGMLPAEYQQIKPWHYFDRTAGAPQSDKNRIQQEFLRLFNCSTNGLTWATWTGADPRISQSDLLGSLRWFQEKNIALFNAQAVYPGTEFTDPKVHHEIFLQNKKDDFAKAVKNYVTLSATKFSPPVRSLQLANEIEGRPAYTNLLGRESVVDWFKWAKEANPKMKTEINGAYRLGEGDVSTQNRGAAWPGKDTEGLQYYFDLVSWLIKQGAPIDYIGIQNHAGIGAAGPEAVLKTLDQFATFGKPLEITEFEVTLQNGNDPKQRQYQADYTRDFFIAVFSHPQTHMIMLQDFWQPAAWQYEAASAFFNKDWSMNPHGKMYEDLVLNKWWTRATGKSNVKGEYSLRGFKGDYEIEVTANGKTQKAIAKIGDKPGVMTVTLK